MFTARRLRIVALAIALSFSLTPTASAQTLGDLTNGLGLANKVIDNFDCGLLRTSLTQSGLVTHSTTRNDLAISLTKAANLGKLDPALAILGVAYSGRIADRALVCTIVKEDAQQDFISQLQNLSSNLSS